MAFEIGSQSRIQETPAPVDTPFKSPTSSHRIHDKRVSVGKFFGMAAPRPVICKAAAEIDVHGIYARALPNRVLIDWAKSVPKARGGFVVKHPTASLPRPPQSAFFFYKQQLEKDELKKAPTYKIDKLAWRVQRKELLKKAKDEFKKLSDNEAGLLAALAEGDVGRYGRDTAEWLAAHPGQEIPAAPSRKRTRKQSVKKKTADKPAAKKQRTAGTAGASALTKRKKQEPSEKVPKVPKVPKVSKVPKVPKVPKPPAYVQSDEETSDEEEEDHPDELGRMMDGAAHHDEDVHNDMDVEDDDEEEEEEEEDQEPDSDAAEVPSGSRYKRSRSTVRSSRSSRQASVNARSKSSSAETKMQPNSRLSLKARTTSRKPDGSKKVEPKSRLSRKAQTTSRKPVVSKDVGPKSRLSARFQKVAATSHKPRSRQEAAPEAEADAKSRLSHRSQRLQITSRGSDRATKNSARATTCRGADTATATNASCQFEPTQEISQRRARNPSVVSGDVAVGMSLELDDDDSTMGLTGIMQEIRNTIPSQDFEPSLLESQREGVSYQAVSGEDPHVTLTMGLEPSQLSSPPPRQPSGQRSGQSSGQPFGQPSGQPSCKPSGQRSGQHIDRLAELTEAASDAETMEEAVEMLQNPQPAAHQLPVAAATGRVRTRAHAAKEVEYLGSGDDVNGTPLALMDATQELSVRPGRTTRLSGGGSGTQGQKVEETQVGSGAGSGASGPTLRSKMTLDDMNAFMSTPSGKGKRRR